MRVAIAVSLLVASSARAEGEQQVPNLTVEHLDVDLGSSQSASELYAKLQVAAHGACTQQLASSHDLRRNESDTRQSCEQHAIENAVRVSDLPLLTSLYNRHFPADPLPGSVSLSYAARDNVSGYMTARMPDGDAYSGEYLEPRNYAHIDPSDPFWSQWCQDEGGDGDSDCANHGKSATYARTELLAGLKDADGVLMRCRFALSQPASGIRGGAHGECLRSDGEAVHVQIPRA
jgi:UrcA family protein